jgi:hypothetical protein
MSLKMLTPCKCSRFFCCDVCLPSSRNDDEDDTHNHQSNHKNRLADDLFNWDNDPPEPSSPTRGRTLTRSPTRSASGSQPLREKHRRQRSSPSTAPPPKRSRVQDELKEIPFAKNVKLGPKPNQKDYEEAFHPMLNAMCHSYAARIVAENAFPSDEERQVWVREIWDTECKKHGEPYELTPRLRRMVGSRYNLDVI